MNITFVITGLGMGGAECQVCDVIDRLSSLGHRVQLICLSGSIIKKPLSESVPVINLNMKKNPLGLINAYLMACEVIKKFKPDVIHSHMFHANIFSRLLRLRLAIPVLVSTAHNIYEGGKIRTLIYRYTDCLADLTTNVSEEAALRYVENKAVRKNKIFVVKNAIDTERFSFNPAARQLLRDSLRVDSDTKVLLAVGRLTPQKDYANLLMAFSKIEKNKKLLLCVIGAGELDNELKALAESLGIAERVRWLGIRYDVESWMSASDVFVLSSAWEGFGLVVAEAMACERVVVATDCGGVKEVLGNTGYLVSKKDNLSLLSGLESAIGLMEDDRIKLGIRARERVRKNFSMESKAAEWVSIYRKISDAKKEK